jgi:hypothetical protein
VVWEHKERAYVCQKEGDQQAIVRQGMGIVTLRLLKQTLNFCFRVQKGRRENRTGARPGAPACAVFGGRS